MIESQRWPFLGILFDSSIAGMLRESRVDDLSVYSDDASYPPQVTEMHSYESRSGTPGFPTISR